MNNYNKYIIISIVILILLYFLTYESSKSKQVEKMTDLKKSLLLNKCLLKLDQITDENMEKLLGRKFYLVSPVYQRDKGGNLIKENGENVINRFKYVSLQKENLCLTEEKKLDCLNNKPILKEAINLNFEDKNALFTLFKPGFQIGSLRYLIRHHDKNEKVPTSLSQQIYINSKKDNKSLCVDITKDEYGFFEPQLLKNGTFMIKMISNIKDHTEVTYVGECENKTCKTINEDNFKRLCGYTEQELNGPMRKNILQFYILLENNSCKKYKLNETEDPHKLKKLKKLEQEQLEKEQLEKEQLNKTNLGDFTINDIQGSQNMNSDIQGPQNQNMNSDIQGPQNQNMNSDIQGPQNQNMNSDIQGPQNQNMNSDIQGPQNQNMNSDIQGPESFETKEGFENVILINANKDQIHYYTTNGEYY